MENNENTNITKKDIVTRLRRVEGQVKGIEKMVESGANCKEILIQVAAIRAAINKVGGIIVENYAKDCMANDNNIEDNSDDKIKELVSTLLMFLK